MNSIYTTITPHYTDFIKNIRDHFRKSNVSIHKSRNEIKMIDYKGQQLIVKSFKVPNIFNQVVYSYFRDSKAKKSYEYSLKIKDFTPEAIGYIEFYSNFLLKDSYFVSQKFDYDFTIREPLLDKSFIDREEIFKAFAKFTFELHENNIFHDDYSPGNILIKKENGAFIFKIVDINRMSFFTLSESERAKNFSKLWADDEILTLIANEYQKHHRCSEAFTKKVLYYSNKNKKIKNFKKRLKGKKVDA